MLQPKRLATLLAVFTIWTFSAAAQTAVPAPGTTNTGRLDELGCRQDYASASYKCERPPLAGRSFSSKQDAMKRLQQLRTAPKPAAKPKAAAPAPKAGQVAVARDSAPANTAKAARAATWTRVANGEGAQYFLDMANLDAQGRTVTARTLTRYDAPRSSSAFAGPYRSTVSTERYDCASRTYAVSGMNYHSEGDGTGKVVQSIQVPDSKLAYLTPVPGTVNEQLLNQACSARR